MTVRLSAAAIALAFTLPATAQTQPNWVEINDRTVVAPFDVVADDLENMDVYSSAEQKIGEVEEVLGSDATTPVALVIDFEDDAGYGDRDDVIVPLDRFSMNGERLVLKADAAAVEGFETYED